MPLAHGRWLAVHVRGALADLLDDEGHLSIDLGAIETMLEELAARAH